MNVIAVPLIVAIFTYSECLPSKLVVAITISSSTAQFVLTDVAKLESPTLIVAPIVVQVGVFGVP